MFSENVVNEGNSCCRLSGSLPIGRSFVNVLIHMKVLATVHLVIFSHLLRNYIEAPRYQHTLKMPRTKEALSRRVQSLDNRIERGARSSRQDPEPVHQTTPPGTYDTSVSSLPHSESSRDVPSPGATPTATNAIRPAPVPVEDPPSFEQQWTSFQQDFLSAPDHFSKPFQLDAR